MVMISLTVTKDKLRRFSQERAYRGISLCNIAGRYRQTKGGY